MTDEEVFQQAIDLAGSEREEFVFEACGEDSDQRERIDQLLSAHERGDSLLDTEAHTPALEAHVPKTIGDFEIVRELGRGGMGVVYEAKQKSLKRTVALKVLSSGLGLSSKAILRFRREAEAAGKLHHTNIVPIYTTGEDRGIHFYAMEMIEGPSLDQVIGNLKKNEDPDEVVARLGRARVPDAKPSKVSSTVGKGSAYFDQIATMIADVASALDHAHEQGVIHRDVKPSNLLLAPDGRLSINDFGLARMLEQPGMTMSGEFVGTPLYMSPEQITAGRAPLDHRTDIYSLGATLYELLTLQPPFPGDSRDQVIAQILHKDAISPRKINHDVPVDLETICLKAIERDPDRRYQTAGQFAEDLRRYVQRHAISARRVGLLEKSTKVVRRNPAISALVCLVIFSAVAFAFVVRERDQSHRLREIKDDLYDDLLRDVTDTSEELILEAENLDASDHWLQFARGLRALVRSDYEQAQIHFDSALNLNPDHIPTQALMALTYTTVGHDSRYQQEVHKVWQLEPKTFEDHLFVGYALIWSNPQRSVELLEQADERKSKVPWVQRVRGIAKYTHAAWCLAPDESKTIQIESAIEELENAQGSMGDSSGTLRHIATAYLHLANSYQRLAEIDSARAASHQSDVRNAHKNAQEILDKLLPNQNRKSEQYTIVELMSELELNGDLQKLALSWIENREIEIGVITALPLAMQLLRMEDYTAAKQVLLLGRGGDAEHMGFLDVYVEFVNPARDKNLAALRDRVNSIIRKKELKRDTSWIADDVMLLYMLGDENALKYYQKDPQLDNGAGLYGEVFAPLKEYFGPKDRRSIDAEELIRRCKASPQPNLSVMYAQFHLGIEALGDGQYVSARTAFTKGVETGVFKDLHYLLCQVMLAHEKHWETWFKERLE